MHKIITSAFLFLTYFCSAQCLFKTTPIAEMLSQSDYVFEGEVLQQWSFFDESSGHIFTANRIEVRSDLKNELPEEIILITKGGKWQNLIEIVSSSLTLKMGDQGVFLANEEFLHFDNNQSTNLFPAVGGKSFFKKEQINSIREIKTELGINEAETTAPEVIQHRAVPIINSITPQVVTAGTSDVITISGANFGDQPTGFALLELRNPDFFGNIISYETILPDHILSWSDQQIQIIIPGKDINFGTSGAGSGGVRILNPSGQATVSEQEITVRFNKFVDGFDGIRLIDKNGEGGYTFTLNEDIFNNAETAESIERAFERWQCAIHSNIKTSGSSSAVSCPSKDGVNLISFDENCDLPFGALAQSSQWFEVCPDGSQAFLEMDIILDAGVNWNMEPTNALDDEFDLESLIFHELGHSHGIGHVLDTLSVMYPALYPGETKRYLFPDTRECGELIIDESTTANNCGDYGAFVALPDCETAIDETFEINKLKLFPNPVDDFVHISFETTENSDFLFSITTLTGRIVHTQEVKTIRGKQNISLNLNDLSPSVYFLNIKNEKGSHSQKIIKL